MLTLPDTILPVLDPFASLFRDPTWRKAQILLVGVILATGQRTVASALRVMGLSGDRNYARYHHVLNRAVWSPLEMSRILLGLLVRHLDRGEGPLIFGIDETLERRRGPQISALGIYRDAVRSSRSYVVKASGLRWVSLMWLGHIPWAGRCWALPFLTVLAPSERYYRRQGRRHKKLTDWARQMILQLRRWLPGRPLVLVGDSGYAVLDPAPFLPIPQGTRYPHHQTASGRRTLCPGTTTPARSKRPPTGERRASAHAERTPEPVCPLLDHRAGGLVRRQHPHSGTRLTDRGLVSLGQAPGAHSLGACPGPSRRVRHPSAAVHQPGGGPGTDPGVVCLALATGGDFPGGAGSSGSGDPAPMVWPGHSPHHAGPDGPVLLDLPGGAHSLQKRGPITQRKAAWYNKPAPTFVDAIAMVRRHLWIASEGFSTSTPRTDDEKVPAAIYARLLDSLAYAA